MSEIRISDKALVQSRMPTLHPWLWEQGKSAKDVVGSYYDFRTSETVLILAPSTPRTER